MKHFIAIAVLVGSPVLAQEVPPETISLKIKAASAEKSNAVRLLPASPDMEDGNGAVVMLRLIWEKTGWMQEVWPKLDEVAELPHDDPKVAAIPFDNFERQLRRAARMKEAHWEYPLHTEPLAMVLLPDVQGLRNLAGRGMKIWIGQQIAKGDLKAAREGILTQLGCARHIAKTPFVVTHLVAVAIARMGLDRAELLIQQDEAPNLYWALSGLPDSIGPVHEPLEWESRMLEKSLPALRDHLPPTGDPRWEQAAHEFSEFVMLNTTKRLTMLEAATLRVRLLTVAASNLKSKHGFNEADVAKMSEEERMLRWVMLARSQFNTRIENAFTLPGPQAIKALLGVGRDTEALEKSVEAPASPFMKHPENIYMGLYGFGRRVKFLQTVEALRDHMSRHDGRLPKSLDDIELPVPTDPFTGKPFEYRVSKQTATLKMVRIEGIKRQSQRIYRISAVNP